MLIVMNPFEQPPTTPRVSTDPPADTPTPRRGRMALVALASAGLVAGGIVGVSAVGSADDPRLETSDVAAAAADDDTTTTTTVMTDDGDTTTDDGDTGEQSVVDGEIVIDLGGGEPIVIDVGDVGDLDGEQFAELGECLGLPFLDLGPMGDLPFEFPDGEFEAWIDELPGVFGDFELPEGAEFDIGEFAMVPDGEVTVFGPDGMTVIDLGDGDASVTITRDGETGELAITTDGTATEQTFDDLFGDIEFGELPEFPGEFDELSPDEIEEMLGELPEFDFGEFPMFDDVDPERVNDCLAELG